VLAVLNLRVLLPESRLISKINLADIGYEDGIWMELAQDRIQWCASVLEVMNFRDLSPENLFRHLKMLKCS
jgi:hypothetical protein